MDRGYTFRLSVLLFVLFLIIGLIVFYMIKEKKEGVTIEPGKKIVEILGTQYTYHIITRPMTGEEVPVCYDVYHIDSYYGGPESDGIRKICEKR